MTTCGNREEQSRLMDAGTEERKQAGCQGNNGADAIQMNCTSSAAEATAAPG